MIGRIPLLAGVLAAQILILAVLWLSGDDQGETVGMLSLDPAAVTTLEITDADDNVVRLAAAGGQWQLGELPADGERIRTAVESLLSVSATWPVATSTSSQARFEVAEDAFQRRVRFGGADGELATLYLGSSPGFRRIHARADGSDAIFSIDFAAHELPVDPSDWLDKQLFQVDEISRITFPSGEVLSADPAGLWLLNDQSADQETAEDYVGRIERLSVLGLFEAGADTLLGESVSLAVEDNQGSHLLSFRFNEAVDEYVLESNRLAGAFTVASYIVEQILVPADSLLPEAEAESEAEPEVEALADPEAASEG